MLHVFRLLYCLYILAITSETDSFNGINTEANVPVGVCVCRTSETLKICDCDETTGMKMSAAGVAN